jgi:hypothetical protein
VERDVAGQNQRRSSIDVVLPAEMGYPANRMGSRLRELVEQQLLQDLRHYGLAPEGLALDWSNPCQEGHWTEYLDGSLEEMPDVVVRDRSGQAVAEGWIDFIDGVDDGPPAVFWLFLSLGHGRRQQPVKDAPTIPPHVWQRLPERMRAQCAADARWRRDPLVLAWQAAH